MDLNDPHVQPVIYLLPTSILSQSQLTIVLDYLGAYLPVRLEINDLVFELLIQLWVLVS